MLNDQSRIMPVSSMERLVIPTFEVHTIENTGLRLCLGAFRTTTIASNPTNPAYNSIFHPSMIKYYEKHQRYPTGWGQYNTTH